MPAVRANAEAVLETQTFLLDQLEWGHIQRVLREQNNNIPYAARALNMHRRTLQRKLS